MGVIICSKIVLTLSSKDKNQNTSAFSIAVVASIIVLFTIVMNGLGIGFATRNSVPGYSDVHGRSSTYNRTVLLTLINAHSI